MDIIPLAFNANECVRKKCLQNKHQHFCQTYVMEKPSNMSISIGEVNESVHWEEEKKYMANVVGLKMNTVMLLLTPPPVPASCALPPPFRISPLIHLPSSSSVLPPFSIVSFTSPSPHHHAPPSLIHSVPAPSSNLSADPSLISQALHHC